MGGRKNIIWDLCQTTFGGTLSTRVQMKMTQELLPFPKIVSYKRSV